MTENTNIPIAATNSLKTVVEIIHLKKGFSNQLVLKDLTLNLYEGENLVVLGKSGSGKSVLIKCIVGLLYPDGGTINVFGKFNSKLDRDGLASLREKVGFLFQSGALYDSMTIKQNLEFPLRRVKKNLSQKERDKKIEEVLESVGLSNTLHKMPSELSGGMRKRASLARTIVVEPQIMLYDEPTTGLDPVTSDEISELINKVQKEYKTSSIIITHDIECARATANRVIMMQDGEVYMEGKIEDFEKSTDTLISSFFKKQN